MKSQDPRASLQLIVSLANAGDRGAAVAEARSLVDNDVAAEAWRLLSEFNANLQRWDEALSDLQIALQHNPGSPTLRLRRALLHEQRGDAAAARAELETLEREGAQSAHGHSPELLVHLGRALQYAGETQAAERKIEAALRRWPVDPSLHRLLAELRWQHGAGDEATRAVEQAVESNPHEHRLRLVAADLLRSSGSSTRALQLLERGLELAPESPAYLTSIGVLLDGLDRTGDALRHLRAAVARAPTSVQARRNLVPTLLRAGAAHEALPLATALLAQFPDDQLLIAWRATALRVLGDASYQELYDYRRLVRTTMLVPPPEYADLAAFNDAFERELAPLHRSSQRPLSQSLRGGSQTARNLPADNPVVQAFMSMIDAPTRDYIARLRDADRVHPTDRRKSHAHRIAGSWSVRLEPGGFHINHVHPQGWLSSAYYIGLPVGTKPRVVDDAHMRDGWLKFGEPGMAVPGCEPEQFVEPKAGLLVLFPSYFWHGTVPFEDGGRRLTAAFDVLPA
jgi:tetratricopeptide (TPR) repeat protein